MPVPLYHCFGMVVGSLQSAVHGSTMVYPSPGFEPTPALESVQQYKYVTFAYSLVIKKSA